MSERAALAAKLRAKWGPGSGADQDAAEVTDLLAAADAIETLEEDIEEYDSMLGKQGDMLTGVVNAIRGKPKPLHSHSHHDVVDLVKRVLSERDEAIRELQSRELHHFEVEQENAQLRSDHTESEKALIDQVNKIADERDRALKAIAELTETMTELAPAPTGQSEVLDKIEWLMKARLDYRHETGDVIDEHMNVVKNLLDILRGDNDGYGWLPSWRWSEWEKIKGES